MHCLLRSEGEADIKTNPGIRLDKPGAINLDRE